MEVISQREFGRRLGVTETTIRKAVSSGWIVEGRTLRDNGRPAILYEKALQEWNTSPAGIHAAKNQGKSISGYVPKKQRTSPGTEEQHTASEKLKAPLYDPEAAAAKKKIIEYKQNSGHIDMQRRAIELQRLMGKLIDKEQAYNILFEFGKGLRENLLALPNRSVDEIRTAPDRHSAVMIYEAAINEALRALTVPPDLTKY